ncbi:MAG: hypothetical protein ACRCYZ_00545 [Alphaproteobacteria bacterium]
MKIFSILFFYMLWSGQQKAQSLPQQDVGFLNCNEEDKKNCLKKAENRVQSLIEHIKDTLDNVKEKMANLPNFQKLKIFTGIKSVTLEEFYQEEVASWEELKENIRKIREEDGSFEKLIALSLEDRSQNLVNQKLLYKQMKEKFNELSISSSALIDRQNDTPLDSNLLTIENFKRESKEFYSAVEQDVYDMWDDLAIDFLSLTILHKLSNDTKRLIAASPSLHPKIQDKTIDLKRSQDILRCQDVILYSHHIALSDAELPCYTYAGLHKSKEEASTTFPVTLFQHQEITGIVFGQKKILPLEIPDFLKTPSQVQATISGASDESESEIGLKNLSTGEPRINVEAQLVEVAIETHQAVAQEENKPELTKLVQKQIPQKQEPASPTKVVAAVKKPPSLQSEQPTNPQQPHLRGNHLQTHNDIFNAKPNSVSFDAFKTLWNFLGGEILSNGGGGSHRRLGWDGKTVGGTYVPHGGHDYGPRSIRSLREALSAIGFGQGVEKGLLPKRLAAVALS